MKSSRKLILYIATSLDGYIAGPDDDLSFLSLVEKPGEDYGYQHFIETIDTVIIGRKTYENVISMGYKFPHTDKNTFILTRTQRPPIGSLQFYTGNVRDLVTKLKTLPGKNIFCDGGAETVDALLRENLIDEFYISIIPVLLGDGVTLFKPGRSALKLTLVSTKQFDTGLVQMHYINDPSIA